MERSFHHQADLPVRYYKADSVRVQGPRKLCLEVSLPDMAADSLQLQIRKDLIGKAGKLTKGQPFAGGQIVNIAFLTAVFPVFSPEGGIAQEKADQSVSIVADTDGGRMGIVVDHSIGIMGFVDLFLREGG